MAGLVDIAKRIIPAPVKRLFPWQLKEKAKAPLKALNIACSQLTAGSRALPTFIIAGAQKCGTSTLYAQLSQHPNVTPAIHKEVNYFNENFNRNLAWYKAHFPAIKTEGNITGEASPYYLFYPYALGRIAKTLPDIRIIILLRNPVDRAYSAYHHQKFRGRENHSFESAINLEQERLEQETIKISQDEHYSSHNYRHFSYLARGVYIDQIKRCYEHFPKDKVHIIQSERYFSHSDETYKGILSFLDLPERSLPSYKNFSKRKYDHMKPETRQQLLNYFRPFNEQLYALLGSNFDWDR